MPLLRSPLNLIVLPIKTGDMYLRFCNFQKGTGATGYIGGSILHVISRAHPSWRWTCLVRSEDKGAAVTAGYPSTNIRLCYGDVDSLDLIEAEASEADIVIHTAGSDDHAPSAEAIIRGLAGRTEGANGRFEKKGVYIHTGGFFALAERSVTTERWGDRFDVVYDDWNGIGQLTSLPDHAPHRPVDKIVLAADPTKVKTAIVSPSVVYGLGLGPGKTVGPMPPLFRRFWDDKKVFVLGKGENVWHNIHVQDLARLYLLLTEAAVATASAATAVTVDGSGGDAGHSNATWNTEGYYLAENGRYVMKEMLQRAAEIALQRSLVTSSELEDIMGGKAATADVNAEKRTEGLDLWVKVMLGADVQGKAIRARKLLGWSPQMQSFEDELVDEMQR